MQGRDVFFPVINEQFYSFLAVPFCDIVIFEHAINSPRFIVIFFILYEIYGTK